MSKFEENICNSDDYTDLNFSEADRMSEDEKIANFIEQKKKEILKREDRRRKNELESIKQEENKNANAQFIKLSTTKKIMYFILLNCFMIEVYSMWVMYQLQDLSALYSLIGAVIGESISFAVYCVKSFNETKEEAKITLEREKFEAFVDANNNGISDDEEGYVPPEENNEEG